MAKKLGRIPRFCFDLTAGETYLGQESHLVS